MKASDAGYAFASRRPSPMFTTIPLPSECCERSLLVAGNESATYWPLLLFHQSSLLKQYHHNQHTLHFHWRGSELRRDATWAIPTVKEVEWSSALSWYIIAYGNISTRYEIHLFSKILTQLNELGSLFTYIIWILFQAVLTDLPWRFKDTQRVLREFCVADITVYDSTRSFGWHKSTVSSTP